MEIPGYSDLDPFSHASNGDRYFARKESSGEAFVIGVNVIESRTLRDAYVEQLTQYQRFQHPHLCEITDVGVLDSIVYFAMPYYSGGSLTELLAEGLALDKLVQILDQLCSGLDYLHQQGYVHGDVKPSNIVLDIEGEALLIDCAELTPNHIPFAGTAGYAAPEVQGSTDLTPQADIYSLGMLLLRVLHGELPWSTQATEIPRARESHDRLPVLSADFVVFSSVIERMVAYQPAERYSNISQLRFDLDQVEVQGSLFTQAVASDLITTREIAAVLPSLGSSTGDTDPRTWRTISATALVWVAVATVILSGAWSVMNAVYERPYTKQLLSELGIVENVALVEAKLSAATLAVDPKQNLQSILAAYEAVLAIAPNDVDALEGMEKTRAQWETEFENALLLNELNVAQSRLNDLLAVSADEPRVVALVEQLETRRHALRLQSDTLELLQVRGSVTPTTADMALHAFTEVLRIYPSSTVARRELDVLAGYYSQNAVGHIESGDIQSAMDALSKATRANPTYAALEGVREQIQLETTLQEEIRDRLAKAQQLQLAGNLIEPHDQNAALLFHSVLTADPDNEIALQGLGSVSESVVKQFDAFLSARNFDEVRNVINRSKNVGLYPASIMHMESSMDSELKKIAEAANFVDVAEGFIEQGFITIPSDDNAINALRSAYYLDPTNTRITELYQQCIERLQSVAGDARSFGLSEVATEYTSLALQLERTALQ